MGVSISLSKGEPGASPRPFEYFLPVAALDIVIISSRPDAVDDKGSNCLDGGESPHRCSHVCGLEEESERAQC